MRKRHDKLGIKQVIRFEWMQKATNLQLAGLNNETIRQELHVFLKDKRGNGFEGERSSQTRTFVISNLMNIWVSPDPNIIPFRNAALALLRENPSMALVVHWAMISATYPFWLNVAKHVGRLLALQEQATQKQIINRLKEQYGDRQTVSRYAQFVIRSFIAWGVLEDSNTKGGYERGKVTVISEQNLAILLYESILYADKEGKSTLGILKNHPAFFPFHLPVLTGDHISQQSNTIDVIRYGLDDDLLKLKKELIYAR